jgi:diguanylate cyclase (GGDEF)-like protein
MTLIEESAGTPTRSTSLRSRWTRSFTQLTAVIIVAGLASLFGTSLLVRTFRDSAVSSERGATASAGLRTDVIAHAISVAIPVTRAQQPKVDVLQTAVRTRFDHAIADEDATRAKTLLQAAFKKWRTIVEIIGPAAHPADAAVRADALTTYEPRVLSLLDQAGAASRAHARKRVADAARLFHEVLAGLAVLELLAVVLSVRLARRLSSEVLRPVGTLRDATNRLAEGELGHRVVVDRADELGDLAVSFNAMADSIAASQRTLSHEANTDSLSGLANRAAFHVRLEAALRGPKAGRDGQAVLFVDLDDFKDVNDTLGHAAGDELLRVTALRLSGAVRPGDLVARLGGDEFAVLLDGVSSADVAFGMAQRLVAALAEPVRIGDTWAQIGASVGLAMHQVDSTLDALMRQADVAMYRAKAKGKHRVETYDAGLDEIAIARQSLRAEIGAAVERGELVVEYQPVVDLEHGTLAGLEALVRWQHPTRGLLPPSDFISLAEETGDIIGIGEYVMTTAMHQVRRWQCRYGLPGLSVAVNVSVSELDSPGFADHVKAALDSTQLDAASLVIEVTESLLADPNGGAATTLAALRARGVRVALDDFGTGYASIGYLRELPLDILKIDRSFVKGGEAEGADDALLEAIVQMARHMGLDIIPEGIEDIDQLGRLLAMGCTLGQGFLFSRPVSSEAFEALLAAPMLFPHVALRDAANLVRITPRRASHGVEPEVLLGT